MNFRQSAKFIEFQELFDTVVLERADARAKENPKEDRNKILVMAGLDALSGVLECFVSALISLAVTQDPNRIPPMEDRIRVIKNVIQQAIDATVTERFVQDLTNLSQSVVKDLDKARRDGPS